ncbi:MAG TPA: fibronectin type III domain-containing protein [Thermoanaerobaculia bacterium]|jgi:hypothetical protein
MTRRLRLLAVLVLTFSTVAAAAAGRPLAPRTLAPTTYYAFNPVTAYAGGRFLTIWRESMGFVGAPIRAVFSDASGAKISERSFPLDLPPVSDPFSYQLVGMGDSFTIFWLDDERRTHMADIDLEGRVTNRRAVALPDHISATIAWNGTHFLAVMQRPFTLDGFVTMFERDGRIVLPPTPIPAHTHAFDIALVDGRFIALTSGFDALAAQEITPAGIGPRRTIEAAHENRPSRVVAIPVEDGGVLVIWASTSTTSAELKSAVLHGNGTRTATSVLASSSSTVIPYEVIRSGNGYVALFSMGNALYRVHLDASGARVAEPALVLAEFNPSLSAAAGPGTILIPFTTPSTATAQIATVAIAADGQARAPEILSIGDSRQLQPVLGAGGGTVLAAWTEFDAGGPSVRAVAVNDEGEPVGEPVHVADGTLAATELPWNRGRAAWEIQYLVVYRDGSRLLAQRLEADATSVDLTPIVLAELTNAVAEAAVVWTNARWVVVWTNGAALHSLTISPHGAVSAARTLDVHAPLEEGWVRLVRRPRLAYDGSEVLLVWAESLRREDDAPWAGELPTKTWATRLNQSGARYDQQPPVDLGVDAPTLSAASSGFEFMVVAGEHARVLKGDGPLRVIAARELIGWRAASDVTWDGGSYAVALRYYGATTDWYLAALRLDGHANESGAPLATATLPPDEEAAPSIVAANGWLIGVQEGTPADGVSATVYRDAEMGFMPPPPGAPRNVHVRQLFSSFYEVNWDAPAEGDPDSYIVEELRGGIWMPAVRVEGNVRRAIVTTPFSRPVVRVRAFNAGGPSVPAEHGSGQPKRRSVR